MYMCKHCHLDDIIVAHLADIHRTHVAMHKSKNGIPKKVICAGAVGSILYFEPEMSHILNIVRFFTKCAQFTKCEC